MGVSVRSVTVSLKADISDFQRKLAEAAAGSKAFADSLDSSNAPMSNLLQTAVALGPALIPVFGGGAAAAAGLATSMTAAGAAAGVFGLAWHGVGDALSAVEKAQLDPTTANIDMMRQHLEQIGPAGARFVAVLQSMRPQLMMLENTARTGLFPGLEQGLQEISGSLPAVTGLVDDLAHTMGGLAAEAGHALESPFWQGFLKTFSAEASSALSTLAHGLGNVTSGLAGMLEAFMPLGHDFNQELLQLSQDFAKWGEGLKNNPGFHEFVAYVRENGPLVGQALGSISEAFIAIVQAGAPVGHDLLPVITLLAQGLRDIAQSPAGPVLFSIASGLAALTRSMALLKSLNAGGLLKNMTGEFSRTKAGMLGLGAGLEILSSQTHGAVSELSNIAGLAAAGSVFGPWGTAIGGAVGVLTSFHHATQIATTDVQTLEASLNSSTGAITNNTRALVANTLEQNGTFAAARQAGLSLATVTEAALGNQTAIRALQGYYAALNPSLQNTAGSADANRIALSEGSAATYGAAQANSHLSSSVKTVIDNIGAEAAAVGRAKQQHRDLSEAMGGAKGAADHLSGSERGLLSVTEQLTAAQQALNNQFASREGSLAGLTLTVEGARAAMKGLSGATKDGGTRIDITSKAGATLTQQLVGIANAASQVTGSAKIQAAAVDRARAAMFSLALQAGLTGSAAHALVNEMLNPIRFNTGPALMQLQVLQEHINGIHGKTVWIDVQQSGGPLHSGVQVNFNAAGGFYDPLADVKAHYAQAQKWLSFAAGGTHENHTAQMAPAGAWRVWAEPETGGEAYIPFANDWRRPGAQKLTEKVAERLGGHASFAAGGQRPGSVDSDNRITALAQYRASRVSAQAGYVDGLRGDITALRHEISGLRGARQVVQRVHVDNAHEVATGVKGVASDQVNQAASYLDDLADLDR